MCTYKVKKCKGEPFDLAVFNRELSYYFHGQPNPHKKRECPVDGSNVVYGLAYYNDLLEIVRDDNRYDTLPYKCLFDLHLHKMFLLERLKYIRGLRGINDEFETFILAFEEIAKMYERMNMRSSIRLTIPVAFMFRTSFLAAAGASRIPVRALRVVFQHSRKGGSRPLCPHDGRSPHGGVRGYYLKKRQELYRVRIFFQEWFRILLIRLSDAEFPYKKRSPQRAQQRSPLRRSFFTVGEKQSPGQPCPARVIRPRGSILPRWSMQAT